MHNLKPFDPDELDETLTRVLTYGRATYLLFPYVNATAAAPEFNSFRCVIQGPTATIDDLAALSLLLREAGEQAAWFISFNTPWLLTRAESENIRRQRSYGPKGRRE